MSYCRCSYCFRANSDTGLSNRGAQRGRLWAGKTQNLSTNRQEIRSLGHFVAGTKLCGL